MDIVRTEIEHNRCKNRRNYIAILIKRLEVAQYFLTAITSHSIYQSFIHSCNFKVVSRLGKTNVTINFFLHHFYIKQYYIQCKYKRRLDQHWPDIIHICLNFKIVLDNINVSSCESVWNINKIQSNILSHCFKL